MNGREDVLQAKEWRVAASSWTNGHPHHMVLQYGLTGQLPRKGAQLRQSFRKKSYSWLGERNWKTLRRHGFVPVWVNGEPESYPGEISDEIKEFIGDDTDPRKYSFEICDE